MNATAISWTDFSANPLKYRRKSDGKVVWGCIKTSPGCAHCYSEALAMRWERGKLFNAKNIEELEPFLDESELKQMLHKKQCGGKDVSGSRCFVGDITDLFGEWVPDELLDRLFAVFALRPDVTWQVLTKRAERMRDYCSGGESLRSRIDDACGQFVDGCRFHGDLPSWPLPNVHLGVSAENQEWGEKRIPFLLQTPAAVRFVSYEPALGPVDFRMLNDGSWYDREGAQLYDAITGHAYYRSGEHGLSGGPHLDWIICGGESGSNRRPCEIEWFADVANQCRKAGVKVHIKQDSAAHPGQQGRIGLDLWRLKEFPEAAQP